MLTINILQFQVRFQPTLNGVVVSVSDGVSEKRIPLLPDLEQVNRAVSSLEKTKITDCEDLDFFYMIVAGCLSLNMKKAIGSR